MNKKEREQIEWEVRARIRAENEEKIALGHRKGGGVLVGMLVWLFIYGVPALMIIEPLIGVTPTTRSPDLQLFHHYVLGLGFIVSGIVVAILTK